MMQIREFRGESLYTILEESTSLESQGSITTAPVDSCDFPTGPPRFGGEIFTVSVDEPVPVLETEQERIAREARNANRQTHWNNEAALRQAEQDLEQAERGNPDSQGRSRHVRRNLSQEFLRIDGEDIYQTPSANLAVAAHEFARMGNSPVVAKIAAMVKAAHCQVNEI